MTIAKFGRITPIQGCVLGLIGYRLSVVESNLAISDEERIRNIVLARKTLCMTTKADFEYDLSAWHNFLIQYKDFGYTHPYAFAGVKRAVLAAQSDAKRDTLLSKIRDIEKSSTKIPTFGLVTYSQRLMLGLAGYRISPTMISLDIPDDEQVVNIKMAHARLCKLVGEDFGYDLSAWRAFLLTHSEFNYAYPYAFDKLDQLIHFNSKEYKHRIRLLSLA